MYGALASCDRVPGVIAGNFSAGNSYRVEWFLVQVRVSAFGVKSQRIRRVRCLAALLLVGCIGCMPVSVTRRSRAVERALEQAERVNAAQHARYELTLAKLYLEKAREASSEAHYASALDLLRYAESSALRADALARARMRTQELP